LAIRLHAQPSFQEKLLQFLGKFPAKLAAKRAPVGAPFQSDKGSDRCKF
jgi:hypothetical protein